MSTNLDASSNRYESNENIERKIRDQGFIPLKTETAIDVLESSRILKYWTRDPASSGWPVELLEREYVRVYRIGKREHGLGFEYTPAEFRRKIEANL